MLLLAALCFTTLFADSFRQQEIKKVDSVISILQQRIICMQKSSGKECLKKYPLDPKSDTSDKVFLMSFPQSFYEAKLHRSINQLQKQKICIGKSLTKKELKKCFTQ